MQGMSPSANPLAVAQECSYIQKIGPLPAQYTSRCSKAYVDGARMLLDQGKPDMAEADLRAAIALGASGEQVSVLRTKADKMAAIQQAVKQKAQDITDKAAKAKATKDAVAARKEYAAMLRERFLDKGYDIKVATDGTNADQLKLSFALFDDVWTHNFMKPDGIASEALGMGFKRVIITDGYNYSESIVNK
jgi:hypothetical protein